MLVLAFLITKRVITVENSHKVVLISHLKLADAHIVQQELKFCRDVSFKYISYIMKTARITSLPFVLFHIYTYYFSLWDCMF